MRTRAHTQDLDQIHADLARGAPDPLLPAVEEIADELPGGAQFFCTECRYHLMSGNIELTVVAISWMITRWLPMSRAKFTRSA